MSAFNRKRMSRDQPAIRADLTALIAGLRRGRLIVYRLIRVERALRRAIDSRGSQRAFVVGLVGGSLLAIVTVTPPFVPLLCLAGWPLAWAAIFLLQLVLALKRRRYLEALGTFTGMAFLLFFAVLSLRMTIHFARLMLQEW